MRLLQMAEARYTLSRRATEEKAQVGGVWQEELWRQVEARGLGPGCIGRQTWRGEMGDPKRGQWGW